MEHWQPHRSGDLLQAHGLLMAGLVDRPGRLRDGDVGIWRGNKLLHMAPPAGQVPRLVKDLLGWLRRTDAHPLVASAAFHYDFEFIHPFSDGNGRMGRLWQTRSEEHTSELQSLMRISYAVFCLKKKTQPQQNRKTT